MTTHLINPSSLSDLATACVDIGPLLMQSPLVSFVVACAFLAVAFFFAAWGISALLEQVTSPTLVSQSSGGWPEGGNR